MSSRVTQQDRAEWSQRALDAEWCHMEDLTRRFDRFWDGVHEFWERYDTCVPYPPEMGFSAVGNCLALEEYESNKTFRQCQTKEDIALIADFLKSI